MTTPDPDTRAQHNRVAIAELSAIAGYARDHTAVEVREVLRSRISALLKENLT